WRPRRRNPHGHADSATVRPERHAIPAAEPVNTEFVNAGPVNAGPDNTGPDNTGPVADPNPDPELVARLRADLDAAGFTVDALARLWGSEADAALFRSQRL